MPIGSYRSGDLSEDSAGDVGSCYVHPRKNLESMTMTVIAIVALIKTLFRTVSWSLVDCQCHQQYIRQYIESSEYPDSDFAQYFAQEFQTLVPVNALSPIENELMQAREKNDLLSQNNEDLKNENTAIKNELDSTKKISTTGTNCPLFYPPTCVANLAYRKPI